MTNDERFEQWVTCDMTAAELSFVAEHPGNRDLACGFIGGIESERARVREIADRAESTINMHGMSREAKHALLELLKELRADE